MQMLSTDETFFASLSAETRGAFEQALAAARVSTVVLNLVPVDTSTESTASRFGGAPCSSEIDWPLDKNRKQMQFWAQINFEELPPAENCPHRGVLMLFVSADYQAFRPKDQSWYKLIFAPDAVNAGALDVSSPQYRLVAEKFEYADAQPILQFLPQIKPEERTVVENWLKLENQRLLDKTADAHQITGIRSHKAREAQIMGAFHANGITFDQNRKNDPHYSHLLDASNEWVILWRLAGIARVFPQERRELYIGIRLEDLIKTDFSKCSPVFL